MCDQPDYSPSGRTELPLILSPLQIFKQVKNALLFLWCFSKSNKDGQKLNIHGATLFFFLVSNGFSSNILFQNLNMWIYMCLCVISINIKHLFSFKTVIQWGRGWTTPLWWCPVPVYTQRSISKAPSNLV